MRRRQEREIVVMKAKGWLLWKEKVVVSVECREGSS
jgi:hypothetical protein